MAETLLFLIGNQDTFADAEVWSHIRAETDPILSPS